MREIREKYGKNLKGRKAVNAAVRAELIGGNDVLDSCETLHCAIQSLKKRGLPGWEELDEALEIVVGVADQMREEIVRRYKS